MTQPTISSPAAAPASLARQQEDQAPPAGLMVLVVLLLAVVGVPMWFSSERDKAKAAAAEKAAAEQKERDKASAAAFLAAETARQDAFAKRQKGLAQEAAQRRVREDTRAELETAMVTAWHHWQLHNHVVPPPSGKRIAPDDPNRVAFLMDFVLNHPNAFLLRGSKNDLVRQITVNGDALPGI